MFSFSCLPPSVQVGVDGRGNCAVATKNFHVGDVAFSNYPFAHVALQSSVNNRCSHCFLKSDVLLRCSRCQLVKYCDAACQKRAWKGHKHECAILPRISSLLQEHDQAMADVRLLLIVKGIHTHCAYECSVSFCNGSDASTCGQLHFNALGVGPEINKSQLRELSDIALSFLAKTSRSEIENTLAAFSCNNFGISDELLQCIGAGIYPAAALLNHSCIPNCILRYQIRKGLKPLLQIIPIRDIAMGEELTHSYVELVEANSSRQQKLLSSYGFHCMCPRCSYVPLIPEVSSVFCGDALAPDKTVVLLLPNGNVVIPNTFAEHGSYLIFLPSERKKLLSDTRVVVNIERAMSELRDGVTPEMYQISYDTSRLLISEASQSEDVIHELNLLEQALHTLRLSCGSFHIEVYKLYGLLLSANLVKGDFEGAMHYCLLVVGFMHLFFTAVCSMHPLIGLQLFTLGDILRERNQLPEDQRHAYSRAREILTVSLGSESDMVSRLNDILKVNMK